MKSDITFKQSKLNFNYIYIGLVLLWQILQNFMGVDGKGRIPFLMAVVFIVYNLAVNRKDLFSMPLRIWWVWAVYAIVNTFMIQGSPMESELRMGFITNIVAGPLLIFAIMQEYTKDKSYCLKYIGYVLLIYTICALMTPVANTDEGHGISVFGNIVPISIVFLTFIFGTRFVNKDITFKFFLLVVLFAVSAIILSATRKAFGGVLIVLVFTYFAYLRNFSVKAIIITAILSVGIFVLSDYVTSSFLWDRINEGQQQSQIGEYSDNWFLKSLGDRAYMYAEGWLVFLENKWCGIGLHNFVEKNYSILTLHTEYMVQLTECGIVGASLFLIFYFKIIQKLIYSFKINPSMTIVCMGGLLAILFMSFTAWTYNIPVFFAGLGVIIAQTLQIEKEN